MIKISYSLGRDIHIREKVIYIYLFIKIEEILGVVAFIFNLSTEEAETEAEADRSL